jgi:YD repeat-containing protein
VQTVVDFSTLGPNPLRFQRTYNALRQQIPTGLGVGWRSNFDAQIRTQSSSVVWAVRPNAYEVKFTKSGTNWIGEADEPERLVAITGGWKLTDADDTVEIYDSDGKLLSITTRGGYQQTLAYNAGGKPESVTDSYGRQLTFAYTGNRLTTMFDTAGLVYRYTYQQSISLAVQNTMEADRLTTVTHPDGAVTTYLYEDANFPKGLTGIVDEKNVRYATWAYDARGRATLSEHAGGADRTTISYNDTDGSRTETNVLGRQTIYRFTTQFNSQKPTAIEGQASPNCVAANAAYSYDANGYVAGTTDWNGNETTYQRDSRGLETSRTEAYGTPQARTITTTWHSTFRVPIEIVAPGKTTTFTYDAAGRVLTKTETDTRTQSVPYSTNGQSRTWTYTWDATGLLQTIDGPRTDVTDITTYDWTGGVLASVTNALSQVTEITETDDRGLPTRITDPNGVVTDLAYHRRGWLTSVTKRGAGSDATTAIEYDAVGQITAIVQPDGVRLEYEYDDAHRLTAVENSLGERIEYTLDDMGNRTAEKIRSSGGGIVKSMTRTYDELGRLLQNIGADSQVTAYEYDKNGNLTEITDPLSGVTVQAYDASTASSARPIRRRR